MLLNKQFIADFTKNCIKANEELKYYIDNKLSKEDFHTTTIIGEGGDISFNIDLIAENIFVKHLLKFGDIYSEESGLIKSNLNNNILIIIDPLDGSANFLAKMPYYGTSVALKSNNKVEIGIVYNLVNGESFIRSEIYNSINNSNLIINNNLAIFERAYSSIEVCKKLYKNNIKWRSPGAVALSFANAINYNFVLFAGKKREFDFDAVLHICKDLNLYEDNKFILVSKNIAIFNLIKEIIKEK